MISIAHLWGVPQHIFNEPEEGGGVQSHMGPSMCGFTSPNKVSMVVFHV